MNKKQILNLCLIRNSDPKTLYHHKQRVILNAKNNKGIVKSNHIKELIDGKIDYKEFLNRQNQWRLKDCLNMFLFDNEKLFLDVYYLIVSEKGEFDKTKIAKDLKHEKEHRKKVDLYSLESFFAINFNMTPLGNKLWTGKSNPTLVVFLEEKTIAEGWDLYKYISVAEDICNVTMKSSGDIKTLHTLEALKRLPNTKGN